MTNCYENLINTGACSIIIGPGHYGKFISKKKNKLLKITKIVTNHNETKHLSIVKTINNYKNYYAIPDIDDTIILKTSDRLYTYVKSLIFLNDDVIKIFDYKNDLTCFYMDYGGDIDLYDSVDNMLSDRYNIWSSYSVIMKLIETMCKALYFLHTKGLAHLDVKPENIMVNTRKKTFKLIDFGFCDKFPFDDFLSDIRGTPGYFPKHYPSIKYSDYLPKIYADDFVLDSEGKYPAMYNRQLLYKVDSYCLGRVLYTMKYVYDDKKVYCCFNLEKDLGFKIDSIINNLLDNSVIKRFYVHEVIETYLD